MQVLHGAVSVAPPTCCRSHSGHCHHCPEWLQRQERRASLMVHGGTCNTYQAATVPPVAVRLLPGDSCCSSASLPQDCSAPPPCVKERVTGEPGCACRLWLHHCQLLCLCYRVGKGCHCWGEPVHRQICCLGPPFWQATDCTGVGVGGLKQGCAAGDRSGEATSPVTRKSLWL